MYYLKTTSIARHPAGKIILCALMMVTVMFSASCTSEKPVRIGITWRENLESESYVSVVEAVKKAGGTPVQLDPARVDYLAYQDGTLAGYTNENGDLSQEAADLVKSHGWQGSNAEEILNDVDAVIFTGGEDISPSLYRNPQSAEVAEGFSAMRDVSDYALMSYCLEQDIPVLAICRGMQVLSVVSGAEMIQDIGMYMDSMGKDYDYMHRNEPETEGAYRDFSYHDVEVTDEDSLLYQITKTALIKDVPSWHHQAVKSVDGTSLRVTGVTETCGITMIEAVERNDKTFVLGLQFHPEIAVDREDDAQSLLYFQAIVDEARKQP